MSLQSLLEIATRACDELGLQRPGASGLYSSTVPQDRQMVALLQAAGRELVSDHDWTSLVSTASITLATASVSYSLPTDFDRMINDTGWDRTNEFPMGGGITPQRHQSWLSSGSAGPTTRKEYRLILQPASSTIYVHPAPTAADVVSFLYVRNTWVYSNSAYVSEFATDNDTTVFNPNLLVKELKWRFMSAKGLDATDFIGECERLKSKLMAADNAPGSIDMTGECPDEDYYMNVPEGNWTLP